jgi:hypothetical protein
MARALLTETVLVANANTTTTVTPFSFFLVEKKKEKGVTVSGGTNFISY